MVFAKSTERLILEALRSSSISSKSQKIFSRLSFYIAINELKSLGLFKEDSVNSSGEKFWKLTEKGQKIARLLEQIYKILE